MSAPQISTGSRSRPQARKKANDDAAYFGPPVTGAVKRHAADKVDGEPRVKRKRVDATLAVAANNRRDMDSETRVSLVRGFCFLSIAIDRIISLVTDVY